MQGSQDYEAGTAVGGVVACSRDTEPTPRTRYSLKLKSLEDDSLRIVNHLNMSTFRRQFRDHLGKVNLATFIGMMQQALKANEYTWKNSNDREGLAPMLMDTNSPEMLARLLELFRDIDLDGDGLINWDEFSTYIAARAVSFAGVGSAHDAILGYKHQPNIDPASRYRHKDIIEKLVVIPRRGYIAAIEQRSPIITFYDARNGSVVKSLQGKVPPVTMAYIDSQHLLVTANADTTLVAWNLDEGPIRQRWTERCKWPAPSVQMSLSWVPSQRLLYSGSTEGWVFGWDLETRESKLMIRGHAGMVTCIQYLGPHLSMVATSGIDTTICLWDTYVNKHRLRLSGGHNKGIYSLTYSSQHRLLFSAGFDHDAFVWSPFVSTLVHRLKGHTASLVNVCAVEDKPELITADTNGVLKLWDIRTLRCVQTFTTEHEKNDLNDLTGMTCMTHAHVDLGGSIQPRIITATKRITFFDQLRVKSEPYTDDLPVACAVYNDTCLTVVTAAGRNVKVWDALKGNIRHAFLELSRADITALRLDNRKRKIIIGDIAGNVHVFNHQTGGFMKAVQKEKPARDEKLGAGGVSSPRPLSANHSAVKDVHSSAVAAIEYIASLRRLLVGYADGTIKVYDEAPIQSCPLVFEFDTKHKHTRDLTALVTSSDGVHAASASSRVGDPLRLWNHRTAKCEAILTLPEPSDFSVLCLAFLDPAPLLAVGCSDGKIRVWATWAVRLGKKPCILEIPNVQPPEFVYAREDGQLYPLAHPPTDPATDMDIIYEDLPAAGPQSPRPSNTGGGRSGAGGRNEVGVASPIRLKGHVPRTEDTPRTLQPLAPLCMAWHSEACCLFSGDESGRVRKWDLRPFFKRLEAERVLWREGDKWSMGIIHERRLQELHMTTCNVSDLFTANAETLVPLLWSLRAHDDAVLSIELTKEPPGLLSASTDQTAKMWTLDGRPTGTLIQGLAADVKSPAWDMIMDVLRREEREKDEIATVSVEVMSRSQPSSPVGEGPRSPMVKSSPTPHASAYASGDDESSSGYCSTCGSSSQPQDAVSIAKHNSVIRALGSMNSFSSDARDHSRIPASPMSSAGGQHDAKHVDDRRLRMLRRDHVGIPALDNAPALGLLSFLRDGESEQQPAKALLPALPATYKRVVPIESMHHRLSACNPHVSPSRWQSTRNVRTVHAPPPLDIGEAYSLSAVSVSTLHSSSLG